LGGLLLDPDRRADMAAKARTLARIGALERIAAMVLELAKKKG
jgi:UDP-N-acetylglucosamine:LPS N-acetylglucosamine transferase